MPNSYSIMTSDPFSKKEEMDSWKEIIISTPSVSECTTMFYACRQITYTVKEQPIAWSCLKPHYKLNTGHIFVL